MPTSPAIAPSSAIPTSSFFVFTYIAISDEQAPAEAASVVFTAITAVLSSSAESVVPALKPYQPNQRMKTPNAASTRL